MPYANNTGADQPAHPRSLISPFAVHSLDSIMPVVSISEISSLYPASVAAQAGLCLTLSETPDDRFSCDAAHALVLFQKTTNLKKVIFSVCLSKRENTTLNF